ncbi:GUN4 domain-containing protein [Leptothoe sp. ISB3NOV94-8A]
MPQPSGPQLPLNERLAEIAVKAIAAGGLTAGGANAFWELIMKDDGSVVNAIASLFIGLSITYGTKLLQPIHQGNEERLYTVGKKLNKKIDRVGAQLNYEYYKKSYLQWQAWDSQSYRPEGMAQHEGIFTPLIEEVFVQLVLDFNASIPGFRFHLKSLNFSQTRDHQVLSIWSFIREAEKTRPYRQLAILAWGGYGKTTLLKHVAYIYGTRQQGRFNAPALIPVLLVLRKYTSIITQAPSPTLVEIIEKHHIPDLPKEGNDQELPQNWVADFLSNGQVIVMFDGFDEVPKHQRPKVARWIHAQMHNYGSSIFIVTSRPKAYKEQDAVDRLELSTVLWVKDFDEKQRYDFVSRWYQCQEKYAHGGRETPDVKQLADRATKDLLSQIETRQELKDLAKNPLLLNMIVAFHRRYPGAKLPKRRVELYQEICLLQLRDRPRTRKLETLLTDFRAQSILQMLALDMMERRYKQISRIELVPLLQSFLQEQEELIEAKDFLEQVIRVSELLVEPEDEVEFAHLSFQEYLAANEIATKGQEVSLYNHFDDDWWKPTILFYAAQVNPTQLIREMLKRGAIDLAYACWQETTKRLDPDLKIVMEHEGLQRALKSSRYQRLEEYLKNGQWREADDETYRLMITTAGKDAGQHLNPEELEKVSCDELKSIDNLWSKYSNKKFGFSIQSDIYLNNISHSSNNYHFYQRVGWLEHIKYDISSPSGHLPCGIFFTDTLNWEDEGIALLSLRVSTLMWRIKQCGVI